MIVAVQPRAVELYEAIFDAERRQAYPFVDAFEQQMGHAINRERLEQAARVLACPIKQHAPNWMHGRVIYAAVRAYLASPSRPRLLVQALDIGTAKSFSALCLLWAIEDAGCIGHVTSVDVVDPASRERRNTLAEVDGPKTLAEILAPWPETQNITFLKSTGQKWLAEHPGRVHVAFIDGKHSYDAVSWETALLANRQIHGDLAIFDDVQVPGVAQALKEADAYDFEYLEILPHRQYAIGRRK